MNHKLRREVAIQGFDPIQDIEKKYTSWFSLRLESSFFKGDLEKYKDALYKVFKRDFVDNTVFCKGIKVDIIHEKYFEDKERSFWHIISEGGKDEDRVPVSGRAEILPWIKSLIEESGDCSEYRSWTKYHDKTKHDRLYIWCIANDFLVVLENRKSHYKLITAFPVIGKYVDYYNEEYSKYGQTKTPTA